MDFHVENTHIHIYLTTYLCVYTDIPILMYTNEEKGIYPFSTLK